MQNQREKFKDIVKKRNISKYYKNKAKLRKQILIYKDLSKEDIMYRIVDNLSRRAVSSFNKNEYKFSHIDLIGCDYETLRNHLQSLFQNGMNFENYRKWELDHIFPISKFNLNNIDEIKKCFNYTNLQPLWKPDNRKKGNKIINTIEKI